jgi:hypothetical protein
MSCQRVKSETPVQYEYNIGDSHSLVAGSEPWYCLQSHRSPRRSRTPVILKEFLE